MTDHGNVLDILIYVFDRYMLVDDPDVPERASIYVLAPEYMTTGPDVVCDECVWWWPRPQSFEGEENEWCDECGDYRTQNPKDCE